MTFAEACHHAIGWHDSAPPGFSCQAPACNRCGYEHRDSSPRSRSSRHSKSWFCTAILATVLLLPAGVLCANQPHAGAGVGHEAAQIAGSGSSQRRIPKGQVQEVHTGGQIVHFTEDHAKRVHASMAKAQAEGRVWAPFGNFSKGQQPAANSNNDSNMMRLVHCVNSKYRAKNMTWATAMADDLASTRVVGAWWTSKQRKVPLTVVTQSTVDRIPQLYSQCKSWQGPVSVVLYQAIVQDPPSDVLTPENQEILRSSILQVSGFFEDVEKDPDACSPDILLVYELYTERQATMLYPINLLRNLARIQARTPLLALVDVDMLISRNLYSDLLVPSVQQQMIHTTQAKAVYVLPAFETYGATHEAAALADVLVGQDKEFLVKAVDKGMAAPFDSKRFVFGHNCTNFAKWYTCNSDYKVTYGERYEPWVVVDRFNVPWHDVRFRGYGNNKIQQIAHINASNFDFVVHHSAFIIHRAHKETIMRQRLITSKIAFDNAKARNQPVDRSSVYGHTRTLFDAAKELMNQGKFAAVVDPSTTECMGALPWWRNGHARARSRRRERATRALLKGVPDTAS